MEICLSQKRMLELIEQLDREIQHDSYHLTRNDQDALYSRLSALRDLVNERYRKSNEVIDIW